MAEKKVRLRDLKKVLDKLSDKELDQELYVNRDDIAVSGAVHKIRKAAADMLYTGDEDPSYLMTRSQLKQDGRYDREEIAGMSVEVPKGGLYLEF